MEFVGDRSLLSMKGNNHVTTASYFLFARFKENFSIFSLLLLCCLTCTWIKDMNPLSDNWMLNSFNSTHCFINTLHAIAFLSSFFLEELSI